MGKGPKFLLMMVVYIRNVYCSHTWERVQKSYNGWWDTWQTVRMVAHVR